MVLTHTDLPEPVAPAMRRWGIFVRSAITGLPSRSVPSAMGSPGRSGFQGGVPSNSESATIRGVGFGTSIPTKALPGMGATMRIDWASIFNARSSANAAMRPTFTPAAGESSNCVTTGPVERCRPSVTSTLNVFSVSTRTRPRRSSSASSSIPASISALFNRP